MSMTQIERKLGIPRSTLSGWFKNIELSEVQRLRLMKNKRDGWAKARERAVESHRAMKALRLLHAKKEAESTLGQLDLTDAILDIALAMLYFGEGAKTDTTAISSSDPRILKFVLFVLRRNYGVDVTKVRFDLHLRMDQDAQAVKEFWATQLKVPYSSFKYVAFDKRTEGRPTYESYRGVCVLNCGNVAIQRKLVYLYTLFCDRVAELDMGA